MPGSARPWPCTDPLDASATVLVTGGTGFVGRALVAKPSATAAAYRAVTRLVECARLAGAPTLR